MVGTSCAHCGIPCPQAAAAGAFARGCERESMQNNCIVCLYPSRRVFFRFPSFSLVVFLVLFSSSSAPPLYAVRYGIHFSSYRGEFLDERLKPEVLLALISETRDSVSLSLSLFFFSKLVLLFVISARSFKTQIYTLIRYIKMHKNIRIRAHIYDIR